MSIPYRDVTVDAVLLVTAGQVPQVPDGIEVQVVRTIAPRTYPSTNHGDKGIRELYFNMLIAAEEGSLFYIENQYSCEHGIVSEAHEATGRGAKIFFQTPSISMHFGSGYHFTIHALAKVSAAP